MEHEDFLTAEHEAEQSVYFQLGKLSTAFAQVEEGVHDLIVELSDGDDIVIIHLIENNSLENNLKLLSKINKYRKYRHQEMSDMIRLIRKVKELRNRLIHGRWTKPFVTPNNVSITVLQSKVEEDIDGEIIGYFHKTQHDYLLSDLVNAIIEIENIFLMQEKLLEPLRKRKNEKPLRESWSVD